MRKLAFVSLAVGLCVGAQAHTLGSTILLSRHLDNPFAIGLATKDLENGPKLIVLVHGATPSPSTPAGPFYPEPDTGTLDYTRFYFSYDFALNLLGSPRSGLKTLSGINVTGPQWDAHGSANSNHKVKFSFGCNEDSDEDHLIVPGDFTGNGTPPVSILLTYRDGSRPLMEQAKTIIKLVHDKYVHLFGSEDHPIAGKTLPSIIFVTHSMGGPVARTILSNPSDPIDGASFSGADHLKAMAIRDKTMAVVMLASPNQGSPLADRAGELKSWLQGDGKGLFDAFAIPLPNSCKPAVEEARQFLLDQVKSPNLPDLTVEFWRQMNAGVLSPERSVRADESQIPYYTLIGHSPGGRLFVNPDTDWPLGGIKSSMADSEDKRRELTRSIGLMLGDYALHNLPTQTGFKGWGGNLRRTPELDIVARYHRKNLGLSLSGAGENEGIPWGIPQFFNRDVNVVEDKDLFGKVTGHHTERTNQDDEVDADGLVDDSSGHGMRLTPGSVYYFDHENVYTIGGKSIRGSWYRINDNDEAWTFSNHETIHRLAGTGQWIFKNVVDQAGPIVGAGDLSVWPAPLHLIKRLPTSFRGRLDN